MKFQHKLAVKSILDEVRKFVNLKSEVEQTYNRKVILSEGFEKFVQELSQKEESQLNPSQVVKLYERYRDYLYRRSFFLTFLLELYSQIESLEVPADNIFNEPVLPVSRRGLQSGGHILPNMIVKLRGSSREVTIFFEVPARMMPPGYEGSPTTLPEEIVYVVNILTVFLTIDLGVVSGKVLNFLDFSRIPPLKTVNLAVVCRSTSGWWSKMYDVREPKLLEEYVSALAKELNMNVDDILIRSRDPRLKIETYYIKDMFVIPLLRKVYNPRVFILLSKVKIGDEVRDLVSRYCDRVFEATMLDLDTLRNISREILKLMCEVL